MCNNTTPDKLDLQRRIQELEQAVSRLTEELEEQKRVQETLRDSEYRFRTMADGTPLIMWVTNADGGIEFINKACTAFFDVTLEQIQAMGWQMLIHPDDELRYVEEYLFCHRQHKPFHAQGRAYRKDGKWRWIETYAQPRFSEDGAYLGMAGSSLDVTERIEAEEALLQSEAKFHNGFENAAVGYSLQTLEGRFVEANRAYCHLVGYSLDELRELHFFELLHPEDLEKHMQRVGELLAEEIPDFVVESRYLRKDGNVIWIRKSASLVRDADGVPKWMLSLIEDITERKRTEQSLRESEKIYRAIGEAIPYGIWICDRDGRNIYASQSYLDLVGITQEQCSEFGWGDTLHPNDRERTIEAWKECVETEGVWDIEHRFLGKDGQYHPILARGVPVRDDKGQIVYWAGINLDISRLKKVEQELKASEEHFQVALQNSPVVVYTADKDLRYTWVYHPPLGISPEQLIGKTDEELNLSENTAELVALKRSVLETGTGKREEIQWHYQGQLYYYDVTVEPICDEDNRVNGLTVAVIDITEKKRMDREMQENQIRIGMQHQLMRQREQERLAIAQDLHDGPSQNLAATAIQLEMVRQKHPDPTLQMEISKIGLNIRDAVQELRDVIAELRPPMLDQKGLAYAIRLHADTFKEKYPDLAIRSEVADDQGRLSQDVRLGLFRIYQAALSNVVRHAGATQAHVRLSFGMEWAMLEVEDNGSGMAELPDLAVQAEEGHYGLAGIKERAEAIKGTFQLLSTPGKGTTVIVRVPVSQQ